MKELVCVKRFSNRLEANVAKAKLESENIKCIVTSDDEGGMLPLPLGKECVQLLVNSSQLKQAQIILK